jgi:hypothetical protein
MVVVPAARAASMSFAVNAEARPKWKSQARSPTLASVSVSSLPKADRGSLIGTQSRDSCAWASASPGLPQRSISMPCWRAHCAAARSSAIAACAS